jgi:hypothetical protein
MPSRSHFAPLNRRLESVQGRGHKRELQYKEKALFEIMNIDMHVGSQVLGSVLYYMYGTHRAVLGFYQMLYGKR